MEAEYLKQRFNFCKDIPWDIVIDKIEYEYENSMNNFLVFLLIILSAKARIIVY